MFIGVGGLSKAVEGFLKEERGAVKWHKHFPQIRIKTYTLFLLEILQRATRMSFEKAKKKTHLSWAVKIYPLRAGHSDGFPTPERSWGGPAPSSPSP